ncbi:MAG: formyltransferase family protein [Kiritimatiellae bacterium]|nr:formyltransferase family protein [Kiritimatiellia bacterium]
MKKYRTIFIGNRPLILRALLEHKRISLVQAFAVKKALIKSCDFPDVNMEICDISDKKKVLKRLRREDYDLCVSAGCPYILPVGQFHKEKKFINIHPSALPLGRGMHPLNECLLAKHKKAGATLHYMDEGVDTGNIIHQVTFDVTDDLDLTLLYSFIFQVEKDVFSVGLEKLIATDFEFKGKVQQGKPTYYSRRKDDLICVDLKNTTAREFVTTTRAFSSNKLGVSVELSGRKYVVYAATVVENKFINNLYQKYAVGSCVIKNDQFMVVKALDALVRIDRCHVLSTGERMETK